MASKDTKIFDVMFYNSRKIVMEDTPTGGYENKTVKQILSMVKTKTFFNVIEKETKTYYFKDIDYTNYDIAKWPCSIHITRALQIAISAAKTKNDALMDVAHKLANYYLCGDFHNDNWWYEIIGIPRDLSDLCFFIFDLLTPKEKAKMLSIIRFGAFDYGPSKDHKFYRYHPKTSTGCNLYDGAYITLKCAILARDKKELKSFTTYLLPGISQDKEEGFQYDGTFFQHGRLIQSGSYGRQGIIRLSRIISTYSNLDISPFSLDKLNIMINFIVNGIKYLIHKGYFNYSVLGRAYSRPTALDLHGGITDLGDLNTLKYLINIKNIPYKKELVQLLDDISCGRPTFTGIHISPISAMIHMNLDGVYMSFRGSNENLINMEPANGENLLGYNLSYGTNTCVMSTGKEYYNIAPVWDYAYLPGTTSIIETDEELAKYDRKKFKRRLSGIFNTTYTAKDYSSAISMYQTIHDDIKSTITCFATLEGMVILGANLKHLKGLKLHTSIEQCISRKPPIISSDNKEIIRDKVLYRSLDNQSFKVKYSKAIGNYKRNNNSYDQEVRANILKISLDFGKSINNYAYSIQPVSMTKRCFYVICNDEKVQAVILPDRKHILAAFYQDESSFIYNKHIYTGNKGEAKLLDINN